MIYALDISEKALEIAQKNAVQHAVQIKFHMSNLLQYFLDNPSLLSQKSIIVTANLPYIKADDWENMSEDTRFEPRLALFGGENTGFELYEKLFEQLKALMKISPPKSLTLYLEMGYDQKGLAKSASEKYNWECEFFTDPEGIERFAKIVIC
jgi:release factor glutamine methyltransferase